MTDQYLEYDGVTISPIGNLDKACPSCGVIHEKIKRSKTPCPDCGKLIFIRTRPYDNQKVFLSTQQAGVLEKQWEALNGLKSLLRMAYDSPEITAMYDEINNGNLNPSVLDHDVLNEYILRTPKQIQETYDSEDGNWYSTKYKAAKGLFSPAINKMVLQGYSDESLESLAREVIDEGISAALNSPDKIKDLAKQRLAREGGNRYSFTTEKTGVEVTLIQVNKDVHVAMSANTTGKNWLLDRIEVNDDGIYRLVVDNDKIITCNNQTALQATVLMEMAGKNKGKFDYNNIWKALLLAASFIIAIPFFLIYQLFTKKRR